MYQVQEQHLQLRGAAERMAKTEEEFRSIQEAIDLLQEQLLEGERELQEMTDLQRNTERDLADQKARAGHLETELTSSKSECNQQCETIGALEVEKSSLQTEV